MPEKPSGRAFRNVGPADALYANRERVADRDLAPAAAGALEAGDTISAAILAQETARRISAAVRAQDDLAQELARVAAELEGYGGLPGPEFAACNHNLTLFGPDGRVLHAGPKALQKLGKRPEEVIGRRLHEYFPMKDVAAAFEHDITKAMDGRVVRNEIWVRIAAGERFYSYVMVPVRVEGRVIGVAALAADLTDVRGPR